MKVAKVVFGVLGLLIGIAAISGSLSILVDERDDDDFFTSHEQEFARTSSAVASEDIDLLTDAPGWLADWLTDPVDVRIHGASNDASDIFFGIAATGDVEAYLAGVNYDEVTSIDFAGDDIRYRTHEGSVLPIAPGSEAFWVTSIQGPGEQTLDWSLETGNWSVVLMNADASPGIDANVVFGAKISNMVLIMWIGLAFGVLSVLGGGLLLYLGLRRRDEVTLTPVDVELRGTATPRDVVSSHEEPATRS